MYQVTIFALCFFLLQWTQASKIVGTKTITEKQGQDVILSCRFEQLNEKDRVMWSKDSVILSVNDDISGDKKKYQIMNKYDLMIRAVSDQDSGRYLCQNFDQSLAINILLAILTRPSKPEIQQVNKTLNENSLGKFICTTHGGNPLPTFSWTLNQIKINDSFYNIHSDTRQSYSELYLPLEKRFHNGILACQIENTVLDEPLITSYKLNIEYKPEVRLRHGQAIISSLNLLVIENEALTLNCEIESNPTLTKPITWLKNGLPMPGITTASLPFQSIQRSDDAQYTCVATNSIGRTESSASIRVQYSPMVQLKGSGSINESERLVLLCDAHSYPSIDYYQWYKNKKKLNVSSLTSSIIVEKASKEDAGVYTCLVKNTVKSSNGSSIEKFNQTQITVTVHYPPKVHAIQPMIAVDLYSTNVKLQCEIDSNPESTVIWKFNNTAMFNSNKFSIIQNKSSSYLIIRQMQSNTDYGLYSCIASNNLGYNISVIQLRSKGVPQSPMDLNVTSIGYSTISVKWKPNFDGGWPQAFWVSLDGYTGKETNQTHFTFTNLQHSEYYNITVRAYNQLGQSEDDAFIRVQTHDLPVKKEDLPLIEHSILHISEKKINYRLNDSSFTSAKIPLCIRIEMYNRTNICQRIVTSSGMLQLDETNFNDRINVSICLDQYENFCGNTIPVEMKRETSFNWVFIIISSVVTVTLLIIFGLGIFFFIISHRRIRNTNHSFATTPNKRSSSEAMANKQIISNLNSPSKFFSHVTYPEQQQLPSSYSKLGDIQKLDQFQVTTVNNRQLSTGSSDPIFSHPNSASLSGSDQLTFTDVNPMDLLSAHNEFTVSQAQYVANGLPVYTNRNKEDSAESGYSTPLKNYSVNKKTVYEVVV